mgnify:CR=1 FL=1
MTAIEKYVEAMENKDYAGLANLFSPDGIINDYCTNSAAQNEYHIYGRELSTCSSVTSSASANTLS